jgi:hypothetical protein
MPTNGRKKFRPFFYILKKTVRPEIETNPELDDFDDEGCLYCGS